jgi:uncharacterized protein YndB with AHSA1/START domain
MIDLKKFRFEFDRDKAQIDVERTFDAPLELVWAAWTEAAILDQWWAPKPCRCVTVDMNFQEGGRWLYYMLTPDGVKTYCAVDFSEIKYQTYYRGSDAFCDADGQPDPSQPRCHWDIQFYAKGTQTEVRMDLRFDSLEDLEKIAEMGFQEGFTACLENLDQYIQAQF